MKKNLNIFIDEARKKWMKMFANEAEYALKWWIDRNENDGSIPTKEEAAFDLIKALASLVRITGKLDKINPVFNLPKEERLLLANSAIHYIRNSSLKNSLESIFSNNEISDDDLDMIKDFLFERDDFQLVWDMTKHITNDFIENEEYLLENLTLARCYLASVDELLVENMDCVSVASRSLELFRDMSRQEMNKKDYWWLYKAREHDKNIEKLLTDNNLLFHYLGLNKNKINRDIRHIKIIETSKNVLNFVKPLYQIAKEKEPIAAGNANEIKIPVVLWKDSIENLKRYLKTKNKFKKFAFSYAIAIEKPQPDNENVFAQFILENDIKEKADVIVYDVEKNKQIALAKYNPKNKLISNFKGKWVDFKNKNILNSLLFFLIIYNE